MSKDTTSDTTTYKCMRCPVTETVVGDTPPPGWYVWDDPIRKGVRHDTCPACCEKERKLRERNEAWKVLMAAYQRLGELITRQMVDEGLFVTPNLTINGTPMVTPLPWTREEERAALKQQNRK